MVYRDDAGRVADFHALRHTFITNLARGGVYPEVAQRLARHSTITLAMDRYPHTDMGELPSGLDALPDLLSKRPRRERQRATGTCDIAPNPLPLSSPQGLPTRGASKDPQAASCCTGASESDERHGHSNPAETGTCRTPVHRVASDNMDLSQQAAMGFEPMHNGFAIRPTP